MLYLTSLLFGTNAVHAFLRNKLFYSGLFILLMVTSVAWHSSPKLEQEFMPIFWLDQAAIAAIIMMSVYYASQIRKNTGVLLSIIGAIAALGYYLCFHCAWNVTYPNEHGVLHGLCSLCFHTILCSF